MESWNALLQQQRRCTHLCELLEEALNKERQYAIGLDTNALGETTVVKENLRQQLKAATAELQAALRTSGYSTWLDAKLSIPKEFWLEWVTAAESWNTQWSKIVELAEENQRLLQHSMRHLNHLLRHLKPLFAEQLTYSARGVRVDSESSGQMLERSF